MTEKPNVVMNASAHRFETGVDGQLAYAEYRLAPGVMTLPHTVVPESLEGRGIASALATTALGYARDQGLKVRPTCPFISGYIARHPEWRDIVDPDFGGR